MKLRDYYCYLTTPVSKLFQVSTIRELKFKALNFGEAEALAAIYLEADEYISRIECELN